MTSLNRRSKAPAGLVDSGAASLASFLAGLIAIWSMNIAELGVYSVFWSAFVLGAFLPKSLVLNPAEMLVIAHPREQRGRVLRRSLILALWPGILAVATIGIAAVASSGLVADGFVLQLALTAGLATIVSPLQDHVRAVLHLSGRSWAAAITSGVQLVGVALVAVTQTGWIVDYNISAGWLPFGALSAANIVSLGVGTALGLRGTERAIQPDISMRMVLRPGRWLTMSAVATKGAAFLAAWIITRLAGPEVLGYAEAARVAAQPLMVLGIGLSSAMSPRLMEAGYRRDKSEGLKSERSYLIAFLLSGFAFLALAGFEWVGNPMAYLVPLAYEIGGLAAVSILANLAISAVYAYHTQLLGGRKERSVAIIDVWSSLAPIALALTGAWTLSFAKPLGVTGQGVFQTFGYRIRRDRMMTESTRPPDEVAAGVRDPAEGTRSGH